MPGSLQTKVGYTVWSCLVDVMGRHVGVSAALFSLLQLLYLTGLILVCIPLFLVVFHFMEASWGNCCHYAKDRRRWLTN